MGKGINFLEGGPGKVVDLTQKKAQGPFLYSTGNYLIILHARNSFEQQMINKYQQEMKKEAEVETFSNSSLFVLLKVLIVSSIRQNLMIIFIFYHKFQLNKNVFCFFHQISKRRDQGGNYLVTTTLKMSISYTYIHRLHTHYFCTES